jgi:hypothetical protein
MLTLADIVYVILSLSQAEYIYTLMHVLQTYQEEQH